MKRIIELGIVLAVAASCPGQGAESSNAQRQTALVFEAQGKISEAEAEWRALLKSHPSTPEAYAHLGLLEARQEHYKEAVPLYRKALSIGPEVPGLRLNLGLALFKDGDLKAAIQEFDRLLKAQPGNQQLLTLTGMAHYGLGEYAEAVPFLKEAAAQDPQNLAVRLALAHSCLWSRQNQCVMGVYREILSLNSDSAEADMLAGEALDDMKDEEGSIRMFRAAVKANPKEPNAHFGLGYLLWTLKEYPEAQSEFEAELANDPNHAQAMVYLADTEMQLNHTEAAEPLLVKALRIDAGRELAHLDLGILYADAGRKEDALKEMKEAARLAPEDVDVHWRLGRLYRTMGKVDEAKAEFARASSITKTKDDALIDQINGKTSVAPEQPAQSQKPAAAPSDK